jgi:hypothetical protein
MTIRDVFKVTDLKRWAKENNIKTEKPKEKHRYFFVCGNKKQKKKMTESLKYEIISSYPKVEPSRYDDGESIDMNI